MVTLRRKVYSVFFWRKEKEECMCSLIFETFSIDMDGLGLDEVRFCGSEASLEWSFLFS